MGIATRVGGTQDVDDLGEVPSPGSEWRRFGIDGNEPPPGFQQRPDGIYHEVVNRNGDKAWHWLCTPIRVIALPRDGVGSGWGRLVELVDPDGRVHRVAIAARHFAGDGAEVRAMLLDKGWRLASGAKARNAFNELIQSWQPPARCIATDRLGWIDDSFAVFVLGDGRIIGATDVVYQPEHPSGSVTEQTAVGTIEHWQETVARQAIGNPMMIVAVAQAFSGPLLEPLNIDGGGLHFRGASSSGKSTLLRAAASVWGPPRFVQSWRATANGLEGIAAAANASLLVLDELAEVSAREAGQAAYMLANGVGKARAARSGIGRPPVRWRLALLSSGEISLADKMAEAGGRAVAGQEMRLLDLAVDDRRHGAFDDLHDAPNAAAFADGLRDATATNHGTAGPAFVSMLVDRRGDIFAEVRESIEEFRSRAIKRYSLSSAGQIDRALTRFGLIAAAGELATSFDITGWPENAARDAALDVLGIWLAGRGGDQPAELRDAIERVRAFLLQHGPTRFEPIDGCAPGHPISNRAGWRTGDVYYIGQDAWRQIHAGADPVRAARLLRDAGHLKDGDGNNLACRVPTGGQTRPRAYAVYDAILGVGHD